MAHANTKTANLFRIVTSRPRLVVLLAVVVIVFTGAGLTRLVKDTSVKAFIPPGHSSLAADEKAEALFGLSDTIAVALITQDGRNVFSPDILTVIDKLTLDIGALANVRSDKMTSLATESSIRANDAGVVVESYIDPTRIDTVRAAEAFDRWKQMYPHQNTLVSADASGAIIMAELANADAADDTYLAVLALTESISIAGVDIHVAGPGAVSGYLSRYIDEDARKLQPLVFLVVLGFIYLAFRRLAALPGPLMVVIGSATGALGLMAWLGVPYFAITNALPVIIVAISVADAIHILSAYYQRREQQPELSRRELVILALSSMARPITLTTLTTIAGFAGIAMMSVMPPITWFAIFAAVGVLFAWAFSILVLPNVLLLIDPGRSPAFVSWQQGRAGGTGRWLAWLATRSQRHVFGVLTAFVLISTAAGYSATHLRIDRSQVENFASDEPIRIADEVTNATFAGTAFLDIIVQSDTPGGLLTVAAANRIRDLQTHFESLAHVEKTVSIVDYLSQLHVALDGLPPTTARARHLPGQDNVIAETLFVYEITGDPADLAEEIDADYQHALVRGVLDAHYYSETRTVVESLQRYIDQSFNGDGLTATLTGDVNVNYHWMSSLQTSHFKGVGLSLILVLLASILVFRSFTAGIVSVVPVAFTVLAIYACMGYLGIYLEPATSMFAAIALGVGVDFAIHLVDRLRKAIANNGDDPQAAVRAALPPVARACFFNSAALGLGFSVLLTSDLPTLMRFGGLVALASIASYCVALTIVPSIYLLASRQQRKPHAHAGKLAGLGIAGLVLFSVANDAASAGEPPAMDGLTIARAILDREESAATQRIIRMTLTTHKGRTNERQAIVQKIIDAQWRATRITFLSPKKYRAMAFLSHDYRDTASSDNRWMYLPAAKRVRSIPSARRGNAFFGTDFSYEDIQSELKFREEDWQFEFAGNTDVGGEMRLRLQGKARDKRVARELGYSSFEALIDPQSWMPRRIDFIDVRGRALKRIDVIAVKQVDGVWTPVEIIAVNHQSGHRTRFVFEHTRHGLSFSRALFEPRDLGRRLADSHLAGASTATAGQGVE